MTAKKAVPGAAKAPAKGARGGRKSGKDAGTRPAERPAEAAGIRPGTETFFQPMPDAQVRVQRQNDFDKKWVFHGYVDPAQANESTIAAMFGGGKYRVLLIVPDDTGRRVIRTQQDFELPGPYKPPSELPGIKPPVAELHDKRTTPPPEVGTTAQLIESAMASKLMELLKPQQQTNWAEVLVTLLPIAKELFGPREPVTPAVPPQLLATLERLEQRLSAPPPGPAQSALVGLKELLEIRDMLMDKDDDGNAEDSLLASAAKQVLGALGGMAGQPAGTSPTAAIPSSTAPPWHQLLTRAGPMLTDAAQRGVDPTLAAEFAVNYIPRELEGAALAFAKVDPTMRQARVAEVVPGLAEFGEWTAAFFAALADQLTPEG